MELYHHVLHNAIVAIQGQHVRSCILWNGGLRRRFNARLQRERERERKLEESIGRNMHCFNKPKLWHCVSMYRKPHLTKRIEQ